MLKIFKEKVAKTNGILTLFIATVAPAAARVPREMRFEIVDILY